MIEIPRLRELLAYQPDSGAITWLQSRGKASVGSLASATDERGYVVIGICGKRYYGHRIAWALKTGDWPQGVIDHIDGDRGNNKWQNLRDVPVLLNAQNRHVPARSNRLQILGVRSFKGKFRAAISISGVPTHIGTFDTAELARAAYLQKKREVHEGCTL